MKNFPEFSLDDAVTVDCGDLRKPYEGRVKKIMVHEVGHYYYIESESEEDLWVIESRLTKTGDDLDSWDAT